MTSALSPDQMTDPFPPYPPGKMNQVIEEEVNTGEGVIPEKFGSRGVRFPGEMDDHRLTSDQLSI